jgi:hypothetical protein
MSSFFPIRPVSLPWNSTPNTQSTATPITQPVQDPVRSQEVVDFVTDILSDPDGPTATSSGTLVPTWVDPITQIFADNISTTVPQDQDVVMGMIDIFINPDSTQLQSVLINTATDVISQGAYPSVPEVIQSLPNINQIIYNEASVQISNFINPPPQTWEDALFR